MSQSLAGYWYSNCEYEWKCISENENVSAKKINIA